MAKHYVMVNNNGVILCGFSDDFEQPDTSAICINEDGGRHFELNGVVNPPIMDEQCRYRYKLMDGAVVERTPEELADDKLPVSEPTPTIEQRTAALETATQQQAETLNEVVTILEAIV